MELLDMLLSDAAVREGELAADGEPKPLSPVTGAIVDTVNSLLELDLF